MTRRARLSLALLGVVLTLLVPAAVLAHPLGNFTINHFAAVRVAPDRVSLDVVIDRAEIPAFQEQQRLDTDGNGALSTAELTGQAAAACRSLAPDLRLAVAGTPVSPSLAAAGLSMPPGAGGLPTMRLVCEYEATLAAPIAVGDDCHVRGSIVRRADRLARDRRRRRWAPCRRCPIDGRRGEWDIRPTHRLPRGSSRPAARRQRRQRLAGDGWREAGAVGRAGCRAARARSGGHAGVEPAIPGSAIVPGGVAEDLAALVDVA